MEYNFFFNQTPIHLAVKNKKFKAVQLLIDFGADFDWEDIFFSYLFIKVFFILVFNRVVLLF